MPNSSAVFRCAETSLDYWLSIPQCGDLIVAITAYQEPAVRAFVPYEPNHPSAIVQSFRLQLVEG